MNSKKMPRIHGLKYKIEGSQVVIMFEVHQIRVGMKAFESLRSMSKDKFLSEIKWFVAS